MVLYRNFQPRHIPSALKTISAATSLPKTDGTWSIILTFVSLVIPITILKHRYITLHSTKA